ncbi:MAG TPA: hypothetical protein VMI10_02945 [Terriglobales bacterium]|nr:hypothetical protein [Terriglobales bacterium]
MGPTACYKIDPAIPPLQIGPPATRRSRISLLTSSCSEAFTLNNAQTIFDGLVKYADIKNLLGKQEDIFIDFKEREHGWKSLGKLADNEKRLFSKAASGFAHQQGGVLIWGIEARKDHNGIDQAKTLKPFANLKQFKQTLEDYTKYATDPVVDGVLHRAIFVNDNEAGNEGMIASHFPRSAAVHRALGGTTDNFYKRHGHSFTPLSTEDIRALFFRTLSPDLKLTVNLSEARWQGTDFRRHYRFELQNIGASAARFVSAYLFLSGYAPTSLNWYDGEGNLGFPIGKLIEAGQNNLYGKLFIMSGDMMLYPGQSITFATLVAFSKSEQAPRIKYTLYAENMIPSEGEIT